MEVCGPETGTGRVYEWSDDANGGLSKSTMGLDQDLLREKKTILTLNLRAEKNIANPYEMI